MGLVDIFIKYLAPVSVAIIVAGILFIDGQTIPGYVVFFGGVLLQVLYLLKK